MMHPLYLLLAAAVFGLTLIMNLVRKNTTLVIAYMLQSIIVALGLFALAASAGEPGLVTAAVLTFAVKACAAPTFLLRLIKKYGAHFSAASNLTVPLTLLSLAATTAFAYALFSSVLSSYNMSSSTVLLFASVFGALFLMINRKGALSAVIGVLSLENAIVLLSALLGLQHSSALEFAIAFDIAAWVAIAIAFLTMMYRQFGTVDSATLAMNRLIEE